MQRDIELEATLVAKFVMVSPELNERGRRVWAATESLAIGYGGDAVVSSATGLARETIRKGRDEIVRGVAPAERLRRPGAGRPRIQTTQPGITAALEALVDPLTRGDPTSPLRWTCKSRAKLAAALTQRGWRVSSTTVGRLLRKLGYSLQAAQKRREGTAHPDRNAQFEYINATAVRFLRRRQPVISVDTKKKELVGQFKNAGREWQPTGQPEAVLVHDFPTDACGKAIPYGVYDMTRNEAWVSVGCDHDTPAFAVASIRQWWKRMGRRAHPDATALFITADAGGSNGYRALGPGNWNSSSSPMRATSAYASVTSLRGPASGTRSSIGCSVTSPRTGAGNPSRPLRPSWTSSATHGQLQGYGSRRSSIRERIPRGSL